MICFLNYELIIYVQHTLSKSAKPFLKSYILVTYRGDLLLKKGNNGLNKNFTKNSNNA